MNDRQLLELAAKAAGIDAMWFDELQAFVANGVPNPEWSPLTDDGDALRLAVKLDLSIIFPISEDKHIIVSWGDGKVLIGEEPWREDAYRRSIVRAAAEIGKNIS